MNSFTNIAVCGASGRVGSLVVSLLPEFPEFKLSGAIVAPDAPQAGKVCLAPEANDGREVRFSSSLEVGLDGAQAVIDFSTPQVSLRLLKLAAARKLPMLIGTTGQTAEDLREIETLALLSPVLLASNTSTSVFVVQEMALLAQSICGDDFDIEIFELHHRHKKDAPSGTALALAAELSKSRALGIKSARDGRDALRGSNEIGIAALRGGDIPGDHTVFFLGDGERVEITQRTRDRSVFARGALRLMRRLSHKPPGLYRVKDLYIR